jgi:hypothetical protein
MMRQSERLVAYMWRTALSYSIIMLPGVRVKGQGHSKNSFPRAALNYSARVFINIEPLSAHFFFKRSAFITYTVCQFWLTRDVVKKPSGSF